MKLVTPAVLIFALAASGAMAAEDIYKSTMPDGRILYGESPAPGAKSVAKVKPGPPATGVTVVTPEEKGRRFPVEQGSTVVLPQPTRPPGQGPASPGTVVSNPTEMPKRNTGY